MQVDQGDVDLSGQLQEENPGQRVAAEVERLPLRFERQLASRRVAPCRRQAGEVDPGQGQRRGRRRDLLPRLSPDVGEGGAQHLVPPHHLGHRPAERGDVERAREAYGGRNVVRRVAGLELVEEPQSLLGRRRGQVALARRAEDGRWALLPFSAAFRRSRSVRRGLCSGVRSESPASPAVAVGRARRRSWSGGFSLALKPYAKR